MNRQCDELDAFIFGSDMQLVEIELDNAECVIAEAGTMIFIEDEITMEAKFGDGSKANSGFFNKLMSAGKRALSGETLFLTHFTNQGHQKRRVGFSASNPGKVIEMDLSELGGQVICQKDAFLCAAHGTEIGIAMTMKLGNGFFNNGFIMQRLTGDGLAILQAGGYISKRTIQPGEKLRVDSGCVVAYTSNISMDIERAGSGIKSMLFGGEGLFLATLQGEGTVWIQSLPFSRFADKIISQIPNKSSTSPIIEIDD